MFIIYKSPLHLWIWVLLIWLWYKKKVSISTETVKSDQIQIVGFWCIIWFTTRNLQFMSVPYDFYDCSLITNMNCFLYQLGMVGLWKQWICIYCGLQFFFFGLFQKWWSEFMFCCCSIIDTEKIDFVTLAIFPWRWVMLNSVSRWVKTLLLNGFFFFFWVKANIANQLPSSSAVYVHESWILLIFLQNFFFYEGDWDLRLNGTASGLFFF